LEVDITYNRMPRPRGYVRSGCSCYSQYCIGENPMETVNLFLARTQGY